MRIWSPFSLLHKQPSRQVLVLVVLILLLIGIVILDEKMEEKKNCHSQSTVLIDLCVLCPQSPVLIDLCVLCS